MAPEVVWIIASMVGTERHRLSLFRKTAFHLFKKSKNAFWWSSFQSLGEAKLVPLHDAFPWGFDTHYPPPFGNPLKEIGR